MEGGYMPHSGRATIVAPQPQPQAARNPRAAAVLSSFGGGHPSHGIAPGGPQPDWSGASAAEENPWPLAAESYRPKSPTGPIGPPQRARSPISAKPSLGR